MSKTTDTPEVMDDNLITRRKKIIQSIEDIRSKKAEIAQALRELGVGKPQENEAVKSDMKQLLEAYDVISKQEAQYMDILKTIVGIHEQATIDIANDFEKRIEEDAKRLEEAKERKEEAEEEKKEKTPEEMANGELIAELHEALLELKKVQEAAVAAAELNEKLVERFQLQKKKRNAMTEIREKKSKELDEEAARVRAEVMERINKMTALKKTTTKQEKELKELQKQCLELGLQLDDAPTEPRPELNEEEKEKRREEIRENIKKEMEKKEQVNTLIREKLAAMDARRQRLQQIRKMLETQEEKKQMAAQTGEGIPLSPETPRPSEEAPEDVTGEEEEEEGPVVEKSLDDILENARANLSNLTAMRERLEHIKETGGADLNEEDLDLLHKLDTIELEEPMEQEVETPGDIESAVRDSFHAVFQLNPLNLPQNQLELMNEARRGALEDMIRRIDEKLPLASASSSTPRLSISLVSLGASELRELASLLVRLAELKE